MSKERKSSLSENEKSLLTPKEKKAMKKIKKESTGFIGRGKVK